jgi:hypothetical protein
MECFRNEKAMAFRIFRIIDSEWKFPRYIFSQMSGTPQTVFLCVCQRGWVYIYQLGSQTLNSIAPSLSSLITYHLEESLSFSLPDPFCPKLKHTFYTHSIAPHQTTHKQLSPDKNIKMRLSIMPLLSAALFLSQTSALPMDAVSADDCHQGLYCGSWDGQAALVLTFF